jgi:hypothetical protein
MAYDKLKEEMYMNVGGINQKAIDSATPSNDVLDLRNMGFERPGGWVSRPGYSLYVNSSLVTKITGIWDYQKFTGESYLLISGGSTLLSYTNTTPTTIRTDLSGSPVDILTFVNYAWGGDGQRHWKFQGTTSTYWQMPYVQPDLLGNALATTHLTLNTGLPIGGGVTVTQNLYSFKLAYVNERGVLGPVYIDPSPDTWDNGNLGIDQRAITSAAFTGQWQLFGFTIPPGFGISKIAVFMKAATQGLVNPFVGGQTAYPFSLGAGGYIVTWPHFTDGQPLDLFTDTMGSSVLGQGATFYSDIGTLGATPGAFNPSLLISMEAPKYQQIYNNMVLYGGFSAAPSVTRVSEIGEPEKVLSENFFETRTNDGDKITGYAVFQGSALVFKEKSISVLNGTSPDDLSQQEVNTTFGCLSNRAIIEFENRLFFLDTEGICEYNGANTEIVSDKLEPFFKRLNIAVARDSACAVYLKDRNEVWFAVPIDSSAVNNAVVVYDTVVDAWTIYDGFTPYIMFTGKSGLPRENIFFGGYTGSVFAFGMSLFSDNGSAISMMIKTRYHKRMGDSTQELWRRFFINNQLASATTPITINFMPNYATSSSLGITFFANSTFQSRADFGLSAKTMSAQITTSSSTEKIKILGYTIESRYLRSV